MGAMAKRPQLQRPEIRTVRIKVQQYLGKKYEGGEAITVYEIDKETVLRLIQGAMKAAAQPGQSKAAD